MAFGPELIPFLFAFALYPAAGGFLAAGHFYLTGFKDQREMGAVTLSIAILQTIVLIFLLMLGAGFEALTVIPLTFTWYILGINNLLGFPSFKPLANTLISLVIVYLVETGWYWHMAIAEDAATIFFGIMVLSYAIVVALMVLNVYGIVGPEPAGYLLLVEGIVTVLFPTLALWFGQTALWEYTLP